MKRQVTKSKMKGGWECRLKLIHLIREKSPRRGARIGRKGKRICKISVVMYASNNGDE